MLLFWPIIQKSNHWVKLEPLKGAIVEPENTQFSWGDWMNGNYQEKKEKYLNEKFGFRSFFIRLNNQIGYDLFHKARANGVTIGKENCLFEQNYIKAYYGEDFLGQDSIRELLLQVKFLQDTLAKQNKTLLLIHAAGKGSFFPELFPESELRTNKIGTTNHKTMVKIGAELGINQLDFNTYFVQQKNKSKYPLYPKYGIHWSHYGVCLVADSLLKTIEKYQHLDVPDFVWKGIEIQESHDGDYDIGDGMNLLFQLPSYPMAYPKFSIETKPNQVKLSFLMIADSYYWDMYHMGFREALGNNHFWFYNREVYPNDGIAPNPADLNLAEEIKNHDIIVIMATEATLPKIGWGFIQNLYQLYHRNSKTITGSTPSISLFQRKVDNMITYIKTDKAWYESIKNNAIKEGMNIDTALKRNAIFIVNQELNKN